MPTTITLYHFNELSDEAKTNALKVWEERGFNPSLGVYEDLAGLVKKLMEKQVRLCLKGIGITNLEVMFQYGTKDKNFHIDQHVVIDQLAFRGFLKNISEAITLGPIAMDEYNYWNARCEGGAQFKAVLDQYDKRNNPGWGWGARSYYKTKFHDKTKYPKDMTVAETERKNLFSGEMLKKLNDHFDYISDYIRKLVNVKGIEWSLNTLEEKESEIKGMIRKKLEEKAMASNLNFLSDGKPFVDQYYYDEFPSADPRWDD
jgi:hypothetical protein